MKFFIFKKRTFFMLFLVFIFVGAFSATCFLVKPTSTPRIAHSIVIDAGHGGRDGGASGKSGITESELNLKYALMLESICKRYGMQVTMTRSDMNGLYDEFAENKKKSEMEKRKSIINSSGADIMVSLHMNSFPLPSCSGAQVFYAKGSTSGLELAKAVQEAVCQNFANARKYVTIGDYFVLNYTNIPSILVECGFLSNPDEEKNLQKDEYCEKFCYSLFAGILNYFKK